MFVFHTSLVSFNLDQFLCVYIVLWILTLLMKNTISLSWRQALSSGLFPDAQIPVIDAVSTWARSIRRRMMSVYPVPDGGNFDVLVIQISAFSSVKLLFFLFILFYFSL